MTLIGPRRKSGAFYKKRPLVRKPRKRNATNVSKHGNVASLGTVLMPNVMFTKLAYGRQIETITVLANTNISIPISGSNLAPIGLSQAAGTPPASTVGQPGIMVGESLWTGIAGYSKWFEKMNILSNHITVKVWADSTGNASTNANLQVVLTAFAVRAQLPNGAKPALEGQSTSDIMAQKGTMSRMISGSGGINYCQFKTSRATKTMLGMVNLSDNFATSCGLQENLYTTGPSPLANPDTDAQWYYYLRISNVNPIAVDFSWTLKLNANVKFTQRRFAQPSLGVALPPPPPA